MQRQQPVYVRTWMLEDVCFVFHWWCPLPLEEWRERRDCLIPATTINEKATVRRRKRKRKTEAWPCSVSLWHFHWVPWLRVPWLVLLSSPRRLTDPLSPTTVPRQRIPPPGELDVKVLSVTPASENSITNEKLVSIINHLLYYTQHEWGKILRWDFPLRQFQDHETRDLFFSSLFAPYLLQFLVVSCNY